MAGRSGFLWAYGDLKIYLLDLCCVWQEKAFLEMHIMRSYLSNPTWAWSDFFWSGVVFLASNNDKAGLRCISAWLVNPWSPSSAWSPISTPPDFSCAFSPALLLMSSFKAQLYCLQPRISKSPCVWQFSRAFLFLPPTPLSRFFFLKVNRCIFNEGRTLTALFHIQLLNAYGQD